MTKRYVVADDGSDAAGAARDWADRRAAQDGAAWIAVHIDLTGDAPLPAHGADGPSVALSGRVPEALARYTRPDDLLVLGTGKTGYLHGRVSGFTGLQIVALAPCAVAVVPTIDLRFRSGIVVGVDRPESAAATARAAGREAARSGEGVQVIHARERSGHRTDDALGIAADAIRAGWPDIPVRARVAGNPASEALLDASRSASLLVIGRGGEGAPRADRRMLGRVVLEVLMNLNSPVLVTAPQSDGEGGLTS